MTGSLSSVTAGAEDGEAIGDGEMEIAAAADTIRATSSLMWFFVATGIEREDSRAA